MKIKRTSLLIALTIALVAPNVAAQDEAAEPEAAETEAAETEETPEAEGGEAAEAAAATEGAAAAEGQPLGPGGKPLQTDYPGTEEAMRARMATDKIQGLDVDPNAPEKAYSMKVEELQTKVDDLKEKVFQSKTRVVLLRETLLSGNAAGARAVIVHKSDLGAAFKLREALYALDGAKIFGQTDKNGSLADKTAFEVYNGAISPGNHKLSITLKYQGSGYGLFSYFEGYDFTLQNSCTVEGKEGQIIQVKAVAFADGDLTTSREDEPSLRCDVTYVDNVPQAGDNVASEEKAEETTKEAEAEAAPEAQ